jgi:hypothetical protein
MTPDKQGAVVENPRLRPNRAPSKPALYGAGGTPLITWRTRRAIERDIERMIDFLNMVDGDPDLDGCDDFEDGCAAEDRPTCRLVNVATEDDEPSDGTEPDAAWLEPAAGHGLHRFVLLERVA